MKTALEISIDHSVATYIAAGLYTQITQGLSSDFYNGNTKHERYFKNKLNKSIKEVELICQPIHKFLLNKGIDLAADDQVTKLVNLVSDISSLNEIDLKRVQGILTKIKNGRFK